MTVETSAPPPRSVLCLGEALVDLICEEHVDGLMAGSSFRPHFGGAPASVALLAARAGARTALAGGAGADDWGRWLAETLHAADVDTFHFRLIHGTQTPLALATVGEDGEASYTFYADAVGTVVEALGADVEAAVAEHGALYISSNTLVSGPEREVTMRARAAALERERPVIFDPNLRLERWSTRADAAASANACIPGAILVRLNAAEARLLTGEQDLERAATALRKTGAANVVISLGARGAMLRGRIRADVPGMPIAQMCSTVGAGDAMTATLVARLALSGFYEPVIAASLRDAVRAGAEACERWGAVD
ncbi:MAG TPA: PfkB family carbohydrate kinase [Solirubrobacteraceae bacterium]|nr:PfkB family carbohydrate kinase [Solirubrobacteraceae bacterium]